ncbi:MAG: mannose-6-phosphate isomerase [Oscillospiraceae bacterium]|nr:mannose-6-phosphate isomerase [Oscillospiraceae bacterium]
MSDRYPMKLKPYIAETVWGGRRLVEEYGIGPQGRANCAEAWLLSARPNASSVVENGANEGKGLDRLFTERPELFGEKCARKEKFPVLVKFIDAREDLSVQVHPGDDDSAVLLPGESGKDECWYILDAAPGAKIYLGLREAITKAQFTHAIENKTLMSYVQPFEVEQGDFFYIPAGTLHAIGRGVLLAEVQQNSDTTYRVYDYNRLQDGQPRQLHVSQAKAVVDLEPYEPGRQKLGLFGSKKLVANELFTIDEWSGPFGFSDDAEDDSFVSLVFLEVDEEGCTLACAGEELPVHKGDSILIPAGAGEFSVEGKYHVLVTRL